MRTRALADGVEAFQPHELIELVLLYAIPRRNVNALAHELIDRFGSASGVFEADLQALADVPGIGKNTAELLLSVGKLCHAYADLKAADRPMLGNLRLFRKFAEDYRQSIVGEETWQFCLTYEGRLLLASPIAYDQAWADSKHLRSAFDDAISSNAYSVLIARYVTAEDGTPRQYDIQHTEKYAKSLMRVDVRLLDHMIVSQGGLYSMREKGDLSRDITLSGLDMLSERYMGPPPANRNRLREI